MAHERYGWVYDWNTKCLARGQIWILSRAEVTKIFCPVIIKARNLLLSQERKLRNTNKMRIAQPQITEFGRVVQVVESLSVLKPNRFSRRCFFTNKTKTNVVILHETKTLANCKASEWSNGGKHLFLSLHFGCNVNPACQGRVKPKLFIRSG